MRTAHLMNEWTDTFILYKECRVKSLISALDTTICSNRFCHFISPFVSFVPMNSQQLLSQALRIWDSMQCTNPSPGSLPFYSATASRISPSNFPPFSRSLFELPVLAKGSQTFAKFLQRICDIDKLLRENAKVLFMKELERRFAPIKEEKRKSESRGTEEYY